MAQDIYGNEVGTFTVIDAAEATIRISAIGEAAALNVGIQYQQPVQPVATFGKNVIFARGVAQGTFSIGALAGTTNFAKATNSAEFKCHGRTMEVDFGTNSQCDVKILGHELKGTSVTLVGAMFNGFAIQGTAQDAFFTQNVSGFFHYIQDATGTSGWLSRYTGINLLNAGQQ